MAIKTPLEREFFELRYLIISYYILSILIPYIIEWVKEGFVLRTPPISFTNPTYKFYVPLLQVLRTPPYMTPYLQKCFLIRQSF